MKTVYHELYHIYENNGNEVYKFLGLFSSVSKAEEAIEFLKNKPGFNKFRKRNFEIHKVYIDHCGWEDGFCTWEEAFECQRKIDEE